MIGIFDSGVGGLTVAGAIRRIVPNADICYFGDIANAPYGNKTSDELFMLTFRAMCFLRGKGVNDFVAACNSVSVSVIQPMIDMFGVKSSRVVEMVVPTAEYLLKNNPGKIIVVATNATVKSGMYERAFAEKGLNINMLACPELAFAIEQGASKAEIEQIISPTLDIVIGLKTNTLVLGCTHYPLVRDVFEKVITEKSANIKVFDPSEAVALEVARSFVTWGSGLNTFFVSKESTVFNDYVFQMFGKQSKIEIIGVDKIVDKSVDEQWLKKSFQTCFPVSK